MKGILLRIYSLEIFIGKIKSPIICVIDGKETKYSDGQALLDQTFDRYYLVSAIRHAEKAIGVELEENKKVTDISWIGEESGKLFLMSLSMKSINMLQ